MNVKYTFKKLLNKKRLFTFTFTLILKIAKSLFSRKKIAKKLIFDAYMHICTHAYI